MQDLFPTCFPSWQRFGNLTVVLEVVCRGSTNSMFTECVFLLIDGDNMPKQVASCGAVPLEYTNNTVMSWSVFPPAEDFRKS